MGDKWIGVKGYESHYQVSRDGVVRSCRTGKTLGTYRNPRGYLRVTLSKNGISRHFTVHRLVLMAFYGECPEGCEAGHIDGNKDNNSAENLRWITRQENSDHKWIHGTMPVGERNGQSKLTRESVRKIRAQHRSGLNSGNTSLLAKMYGVSPATIRRVISRTRWNAA